MNQPGGGQPRPTKEMKMKPKRNRVDWEMVAVTVVVWLAVGMMTGLIVGVAVGG